LISRIDPSTWCLCGCHDRWLWEWTYAACLGPHRNDAVDPNQCGAVRVVELC